jgi:hypothetical protein
MKEPTSEIRRLQEYRSSKPARALGGLLVLTCGLPTLGQYALDWFTQDGGGGKSIDGEQVLSAEKTMTATRRTQGSVPAIAPVRRLIVTTILQGNRYEKYHLADIWTLDRRSGLFGANPPRANRKIGRGPRIKNPITICH